MASMDIEDTVIDDVGALLTAASIAWHAEGSKLASSVDYSAGRVAVKAEVQGPTINGGQWPAGFPSVALTLSCETYLADDTAGATCRNLAKLVRQVIEVEELPTNLTAASTRATYYAFRLGPSINEPDEDYNVLTLTYSLILRPSQ